MTREEFAYWTAETARSTTAWRMDPLQLHNNKVALFYKGGENGVFLNVDPTGKATGGTYEGAIQHICEAGFRVQHTRQFASFDDAITSLCEKLGTTFFMTAICNL